MLNPFLITLKMQQAALEGMVFTTRLMASSCLRLMDQQQRTLHHHTLRRAEDFFRPDPILPKGADLKDHYGNRCHDVEVERI